jgi:membrane fusion protein (multidrug efflux system)
MRRSSRRRPRSIRRASISSAPPSSRRPTASSAAEIEVDGYGGRSFSGHVDSIAAATGATFSLLPPDNATGNFVKVVQRIPVKVLLDDARDANTPLRPGMSVDATVYLK